MIIDRTIFAVGKLTLLASLKELVRIWHIVHFPAVLASIVSGVLLTLAVNIKQLKLLCINWRRSVWIIPSLAAPFASAYEICSWFQRTLIFDQRGVLEKEHLDHCVYLWIRKVVINFALLFIARMLSEMFAGKWMIIKMIDNFLICYNFWIIIVCVTILALQPNHFAFFSEMLSQPIQTKFS